MENFPHLVKMHKKYKRKGLVVLTVSLDGANGMGSKEVNKAVARVLEKFKAPFPTFVLDESFDFIEKKLKFLGPPAVYVFDRQGKSTMFSNDEETQVVSAVIEKLVVNLLNKKK